MTRGHDLRQWFLWGCLAILALSATAQANTLTKVHVAESDGRTQLFFYFTTSPRYEVSAELEHKRLVMQLAKSAAKSEYSLRHRAGGVIQDIAMYQTRPQSSAEAKVSEGDLRIEVHLKTSAVTVSHRTLRKPAGFMLNIHQVAPAAKTVTGGRHREVVKVVKPVKPTEAAPLPHPSISMTTAPSPVPHALALLSPDLAPAAEEVLREDQGDVSGAQLVISAAWLPALSGHDHGAAPVPPTPSALPAMEEMRRFMGNGTATAALALLDLYFHRSATFAGNPSLLWAVASAYVDLGLYEQGDELYRTLAASVDHSALQAAAVLKRGKIALLQGELATAERLLRDCIDTAQHGALLAEAHEALGDTLLAQEKFAAATAIYEVALRYTPEAHKPLQLLHKLGSAQRKADQWLRAAEVFQQAVHQLSSNPTGTHVLQAMALPPSFAGDLFQQLGDSLHKLERHSEAIVAYRGVLHQSPTVWQTGWTLYHLGRSHEALGQYDQATLTYQELARQDEAMWAQMGQQALSTVRWQVR